MSRYEELSKLKELLDAGVLSKVEFEAMGHRTKRIWWGRGENGRYALIFRELGMHCD